MRQVTDEIYQIAISGLVNIYLIRTPTGLALVDTAVSPGTVKRVEREVARAGFALDAIETILITHAHFDHVAGLSALQAALPHSRTYIGKHDAPVLRGEQPPSYAKPQELSVFGRMLLKLAGSPIPSARVDQELQEGDVLDHVLPGLCVVALPGHTRGQIGFWWPKRKLLIGADAVSNVIGLKMPFRPLTTDWNEAKRTVKKLSRMGVDVLCVGHGGVRYSAHDHLVALSAKHPVKRAQ